MPHDRLEFCQSISYEQLVARGFSLFLPKLDVWSRRGGIRHRISLPMFPSYLFLHHAMDKLNGTITHDKFCCARWGTLQLSWWRRPLRLRHATGQH
jgi:hypothetical protein